MKKIKKYIMFFFIAILAIVVFFQLKYFIEEDDFLSHGNSYGELIIEGKEFKMEEVTSPEKMAKGLGGREALCNQCGMIFIFEDAAKHSFWMKDMRIPLDIFWLHGKNIVHIEKNIPADSQAVMNPNVLSDKVIELVAGTADEVGIAVGTGVIFQKSEIFPWKKLKKIFNF